MAKASVRAPKAPPPPTTAGVWDEIDAAAVEWGEHMHAEIRKLQALEEECRALAAAREAREAARAAEEAEDLFGVVA